MEQVLSIIADIIIIIIISILQMNTDLERLRDFPWARQPLECKARPEPPAAAPSLVGPQSEHQHG